MTATEQYLPGLRLPQPQEVLDEQIGRLLETLRAEYHGDLHKLYADRTKGRKKEPLPEPLPHRVMGAFQKRSSR